MKLVIEVVATNMNTGHIAINQQTVEIFNLIPKSKADELSKKLLKELTERQSNTTKIGDILITRNYTLFAI